MLDRLKPTREFLTDVLHLLVLWSFAAAQPLFDLLGRNPEFFVARRSRPVTILLLTLGLSFFAPLLLAFLEWLASLVGRRVQKTIHALMVTALAALVAMPVLKRVGDAHPGILIAGAVLLGLFVGVGCVRLPFVRLFLTVLSPAIVLFPLLFLLYSPVRRIVFPQPDTTDRGLEVKATAPVVMVVFDEFTSVSLMDEHHDIDPLRYPNLAAFAKESTWFRNATTVNPATAKALIAILTGLRPDPHSLPTAQDYPRNLFTLLQSSYGMGVVEPITHLCPDTVCRETAPLPPVTVSLRSMFLDLSAIYLHVVLPTALTRSLPVVTQSWGDFWDQGKGHGAAKNRDAAVRGWADPKMQFEEFLKSIAGTKGPKLYFLHVALPHVPWQFLPSGKQYTDPRLELPGLDFGKEQWGKDNWLVVQGYQRYLLQVGFADKLLGELVARLKALGLYDDSLVLITADHGVSFRAGRKRRKVEWQNYQDIMPIPLFVKGPGQRGGRIDDRNVESIDILPTIADILGIKLPWPIDGTSAWNPSLPERREKLISNPESPEEVFKFDAGFPAKYSALEEKLALFGSGTRPDGLFKIGPFRDLIGKPITEVDLAGETAVEVDLDQPSSLFKGFTPGSDFVPALISGEVRERGSVSPPRLHLAIVVNGIIQAVTRTFDEKKFGPTPALSRTLGVAGFDAMVPETAFQAGDNEVQVLVVSRGVDGRTRLAYTETRSPATYSLLQPGNPQRIVSSRGASYPVDPRAVAGSFLIQESGNAYLIAGWAADLNHSEPAETIIVFSGGRCVYAAPLTFPRSDVAKYFKKPSLRDSGFKFALPSYLFRGSGNSDISIFALSKRGMASRIVNPDVPPGRAKSRT